MSHWRSHESDVLKDINKGMLATACKEIGVEMDETIKSISNAYGKSKVDAGIKFNGKAVSIGFLFKENNGKTELQLTGDFYATGLSESNFMDKLSQQYMKLHAVKSIEDDGTWLIDNITTDVNGDVVIVANMRESF